MRHFPHVGDRVVIHHADGADEEATVDEVDRRAEHPALTVHFDDGTFLAVSAFRADELVTTR